MQGIVLTYSSCSVRWWARVRMKVSMYEQDGEGPRLYFLQIPSILLALDVCFNDLLKAISKIHS